MEPAKPTAAAAPAGVRFRGKFWMPVGVFFQTWTRAPAGARKELFRQLEHDYGSRFGLSHEALLGNYSQRRLERLSVIQVSAAASP